MIKKVGMTVKYNVLSYLIKEGFIVNHVIHPPRFSLEKSDSNSLLVANRLCDLKIQPTILGKLGGT